MQPRVVGGDSDGYVRVVIAWWEMTTVGVE